ncbi:MAG: hypothetical protein AB9835_14365 [Eubacteriales bacterium]
MKASEVIQELQKRIDYHGDCEVVFRDADDYDSEDIDVMAVYYDEDADRVVVSNQIDFFG